jgi:hypothetical protein
MSNDAEQHRFLIAYENIGLDVGESLEGRRPYIRRVIAQTRAAVRQKRREMGQPYRLLAGIDVIGGSQQEGATVVAETFGLLVDLLEPTDNIYVAWNPHDEPRFVRDLVAGRDASPPDVYALRINGMVESAGVSLTGKAPLGRRRGRRAQ